MAFLFITGQGPQTGPKGVIEDWRRFKQLETEKRQDNERERVALCKKLALTCRSEREDKEADAEVEKLEQVKAKIRKILSNHTRTSLDMDGTIDFNCFHLLT